MPEVRFSALAGTNPLAFMAALGAQVAVANEDETATLRWTDEARPVAVLASQYDLGEIAETARRHFEQVLSGTALSAGIDQKLKFDGAGLRGYLAKARSAGSFSNLAQCLVAENSLDNQDKAKPTDLYFTAGQQKFVEAAREVLEGATTEVLMNDLAYNWKYESKLKSLMWDVVDDRVYALSAFNPSGDQKMMNPGAEALAVIGLSRFPCFRAPDGTATLGCAGRWKLGSFTWPLWTHPASTRAVTSLLAHASMPEPDAATNSDSFEKRSVLYEGWGITQIMQSQIRRSDQGGYGTFGPPRVIWKRG